MATVLAGCLIGPTTDIIAIATGYEHSCMVRADATVWCWGAASNLQTGTGTSDVHRSGVQVPGITSATDITAGRYHTCSLLSDQTVTCWGRNWEGQIGNGGIGGVVATPTVVAGLTGVVQITAGDHHTCARKSDGTVMCWGANNAGQVGDLTNTNRTTPTLVAALTGVVDLDATADTTCVARSSKTAWCWGANTYGQIGDGTTTNRNGRTRVTGLLGAGPMTVAVGVNHACAASAGLAWCWGRNDHGQIGDGTTVDKLTYTAVSGLTDAADLSAGNAHSCTLRTTGAVTCWGLTDYFGSGELLGDPTLPGPNSLTPTGAVVGVSGATELDGGWYTTCAVHSGGRGRCWGINDNGQLGDGTLDPQIDGTTVLGFKPGAVGGPSPLGGITKMSVQGTTCAILTDGTATCWGDGQVGRLGDGSNDTATPTHRTTALFPVAGLTNVTDIESSGCAIAAGDVHCWGWGLYGQLGDQSSGPGFQASRGVPGPVIGLTSDLPGTTTHPLISVPPGIQAIDISAPGATRCAVLSEPRNFLDGVDLYDNPDPDIDTLYSSNIGCWGYGNEGETGDGHAGTIADVPVGVKGITDAVQVAVSGGLGCALLAGGSVSCWGLNGYGQLGDGTVDGNWNNTARTVSGLSDAVEVAVADTTSCARRAGGTILCWGRNNEGQLGNGTTVDNPVPGTVTGISDAVELDLGEGHFGCARRADATVSCWGNNYWSTILGAGAAWPVQSTPLTITGITGATSIDIGESTACAVVADQSARCWGWNGSGAIGDGTTTSSPTAPQVVIRKVIA